MEFDLSEKYRMLRDTMQRFVEYELIPVEMESRDGVTLKPEYREKFLARAKELGIWKMEVPEEFGGVGANLISPAVVREQIGRTVAQPTRGQSGIGLTTELPIEWLWRQSRAFRITEGATEVMKMVIAHNILREYG